MHPEPERGMVGLSVTRYVLPELATSTLLPDLQLRDIESIAVFQTSQQRHGFDGGAAQVAAEAVFRYFNLVE